MAGFFSKVVHMLKNKIQEALSAIIKGLYSIELNSSEINVDFPTIEGHGDYTSNIAMILTKYLPKEPKQSPIDIAKNIANKLIEEDNHSIYEKVEIVAPGFINITISLSHLTTFIQNSLESQMEQIQAQNKDDQRILVEFIGPNTNKPLHIGHLRNACLGQALLNLNKSSGKNVIAANINNDRGIHIIKSMYGYLMYGKKDSQYPVEPLPHYKKALQSWAQNPLLWETPESKDMKPDHLIGYYYILGNTDYELSETRAKEEGIDPDYAPHNQMKQMLIDWESNEPIIRKLWIQNNGWYYEGMKETLRHFGVASPNDPAKFFDKEWYESEIYKEGKDIVINKIGNGVITEYEDGHVEANLESYKLPNIVLLRKNKTSLYITQDIELMRKRIQEDHVSNVVILTDYSQNLQFQQLFAICESLEIAQRSQMKHLGYGSVRLPDGKMSSRKGNVILIDELLAEIEERAIEKINQERADYSDEEKEEISRQVAIAAIKYGILKYNALSNIVFDIDSSISFEGDTGPYLQYTFARTSSILRKYNDKFLSLDSHHLTLVEDIAQLSSEERDLIHYLYKFPETVVKAAQQYSPNYLCEYLFNLSQKFNFFYTTKPIMSENSSSTRIARMIITRKSNEVLKLGLSLLGIEAPDKM
jgi:arginyl-tRNA synthetase